MHPVAWLRTNAHPDRVFGAEPGRSRGGRQDGLFLLIVAFTAAAVVIVDTFSVAHDRAAGGRPIALWEPLVWEASSGVVLVALAPVLMALARWCVRLGRSWRQIVPAQLAGAVAFSVIHVAAMGAIRWAVYSTLGGDYSALKPLLDFPYEFRKDLLTYAIMTSVYLGWLRLIAQPSPSPEPEAIEVRDGARRHYVPATEILWVEAAGNYVELHRGASPLLHRASLTEMELQLRDAGFVRIHRSRLVRRDAVTHVESKPSGDYIVRMSDGRELAGSRRYRQPLLGA